MFRFETINSVNTVGKALLKFQLSVLVIGILWVDTIWTGACWCYGTLNKS